MSATGKRLDKIEASLTPQAAFLVWLAEVKEYPSISAFATALKDAPDSSYPMYRLPHAVAQAVEHTHKGENPEAIYRAVRQPVQDVAFLYSLHGDCNIRLMEDWRAMCLQIALAASHLGRLFEHETPQRDELAGTRHIALTGITELWEWDAAIRLLGDRYFGGESPLYPAWAEELTAICEQAETMATLYNEHLDWPAYLAETPAKPAAANRAKAGRQPKNPTILVPAEPIDLDALRRQTQAGGRELARHLVAMAQAEALRFMDEPRAALALGQRRRWPGPDSAPAAPGLLAPARLPSQHSRRIAVTRLRAARRSPPVR
jgi:hypothetical protein